jgi:Fur family ferric uptake transcriptional regulator
MNIRARQVFLDYLKSKNLRYSEKRQKIADIFISFEGHLTPEELYIYVRRKIQSVGLASVYRTLKLLRDSGIARELTFLDGSARYEFSFGKEHHDHMICIRCGTYIEAVDMKIEKLQEKMAKDHGFQLMDHRMELYGYCKNCQNKNFPK